MMRGILSKMPVVKRKKKHNDLAPPKEFRTGKITKAEKRGITKTKI